MKAVLAHLATSGRASRTICGLAATAALAAFVWPVERISPAAPTALAPEARGEAALRRPLFDPGRRAWTAQGTRAMVLEGEPHRPIVAVRGIVLDGAEARALVDDGSGDERWLARGEGRADWHVTAITADRVTLMQNGRLYTAEFMGAPATLRAAALPRSLPDTAAPELRN